MSSSKKDEGGVTQGSSPAASRTQSPAATGGETTMSAIQEGEQQFQVERAIDQTKESVRRSIEESRREIPQYAQSLTDYHQQAMDSAEEITDNYLDSQKQIINSAQKTWTRYLETVYWWMSPNKMAQMYTQAVSTFADNAVSANRIWNKTVLGNMDATKALLGRAREASKDVSRINVNTAIGLERTADQLRSSANSDSTQKSSGKRY